MVTTSQHIEEKYTKRERIKITHKRNYHEEIITDLEENKRL